MNMTGKFLGTSMLAALMTISVPAYADVKAGVDAWENGDFPTAISEWRGPALAGDPDAQFNMGQAYKLGRGVPMDLAIAEDWFRKASDQGHLQAADNYGLILFQSNRRDEAMPYIRASAARGEPRAQYVLGTAHFNGDLAPKDWVKAYALMTRASASGLPQASKSLTTMDQYIPLDQREKGLAMAVDLERKAKFADNGLLADTTMQEPAATGRVPSRPAALPSRVETAQLPPSRIEQPAPVQTTQENIDGYIPSVPAPSEAAPSVDVAANAGADFDTPSTPPPPSLATAPSTTPAISTATAPPVPVQSGDWRVQLGAFSTQAKAKDLWNTLEAKNASLSGFQPYLVNAGAITRLQAGPFASKTAAEKICALLGNQACFAVKK